MPVSNRQQVVEFWGAKRRGATEQEGYRKLLERWLNREGVLKEGTCFEVGGSLLEHAIVLLILEDDALANKCLLAAGTYLEAAIQSDDLGNYGRLGLRELGRSQRLRNLSLARWLTTGRLSRNTFRAACEAKVSWNHQRFSKMAPDDDEFDLHEWVAEMLVLGDVGSAERLCDQYYWSRMGRREPSQANVVSPTETLALVTTSLVTPTDASMRIQAEARLDDYYASLTAWGPGFQENAVPYSEKLLYAYVRGHFFKGVEEPVRLVRMMKFSE